MKHRPRLSMLVAVFAAVSLAAAQSGTILLPADAGVLNVKQHGVKGDGVTDDADSLNKLLLGDGGVVYLPSGTYLVKKEVWFCCWKYVIGQSRDSTIIKLSDNNPLYQDTTAATWVFGTTDPRDPSQTGGGRNTNFSNYVMNLTVSIGKGNPGASGIDFLSNNGGGLRNVLIVADDGTGRIGLDMRKSWPGPALCRDVTVRGFNWGVWIGCDTYYSAFVNLTVENQRIAGMRDEMHALSIENFVSRNSVPALVNAIAGWGAAGQCVIVGAALTGGSPANNAIENDCGLYLRNVTTAGYKAALRDRGTTVAGPTIREYITEKVSGDADTIEHQFLSPKRSLWLPVKPTPLPSREPLSAWTNVMKYQAQVVNGDWGPAIQAAIDSGATTLYFPLGSYDIRSTVVVRNKVQCLQGIYAELRADGNALDSVKPVFRVESTSAACVLFDMFVFSTVNRSPVFHIEDACPKPVIVTNSRYLGYRNAPGCGELYVEDMCGAPWRFNYPQKVWIRHLNVEGAGHTVINNAADLYLLGIKTEGGGTDIYTGKNGNTELLGGLLYPTDGGDFTHPCFVNAGGHVSLIHSMFWAQTRYIDDTWNSVTRTLTIANGRRFMHLYVCNPDNIGAPVVRGEPPQPALKPGERAPAYRFVNGSLTISGAPRSAGGVRIVTLTGRVAWSSGRGGLGAEAPIRLGRGVWMVCAPDASGSRSVARVASVQ